jgi:hypothetical protein
MPAVDRVALAQWSLPYFTGLPRDVVTNNLHFVYTIVTEPDSSNYDDLAGAIQLFYDEVYGVLGMGTWCVKAGATITFYDLTDTPPRAPIQTNSVPVTNTQTNGTAPTESAVCLSFQGTHIAGIPQSRQRGRIFIGGLTGATSAGSSSSFPMINSTITGLLADAMDNLRIAAAAVDWLWVVYSPTQNLAHGTETFEVTNGWVDNTIDTQRRRGVEATARSIWP